MKWTISVSNSLDEVPAFLINEQDVYAPGCLPGQYVELVICDPMGRATGYDIDVRRDHPHAFYGMLDFDVVLCEKGDVFYRAVVRILKMFESIRTIRQYLVQLEKSSAPVAVA